MIKSFPPLAVLLAAALCVLNAGVWNASILRAEIVVDFETLPVNEFDYYNGDVSAGSPLRDNYTILDSQGDGFGGTKFIQQWTTEGVAFGNTFNSGGFWNGWVWSSVADSITPGFGNQYASFPGGGSNGTGGATPGGTYAVAFGGSSYFNVPDGFRLSSADFTNTTYAALSMRDGDAFAKQFGGDSGNDPDFFRAILTGYDSLDAAGNALAELRIDLSDFTFDDNNLDYILDRWINVDLTSLGAARSVGLSFESSDVGSFGINTPTYLAMDNLTLTAVPEPGSFAALSLVVAALLRRRLRIPKVTMRVV